VGSATVVLVGQSHIVPQERIGRYEVLRKIATGGMAELFLAKQVGMEGFEKVVAIKRILAHLAYDEEFINMFRDEARIVAKLSHPNIVQIYDLGKSDDTYFIAMEYIPGRNLSSVAKKAKAKGVPLPPEYIARCIAQACEGLYYAHTRQDIDGMPLKIVHRDVSPQNIILAFSGGVKLVDFGIAKAATKIAHTRAGVLKGKYAYMSPEQIRGDEVDARSDLFAVGIVLYELLCGRRPFEKENSIQTLKAIVQEPHVDCRLLNPDIPDALAAIIDKALAKHYNDRWQSAQELQLALEDMVSSSGKRCNNIAISKWVTELFEEELSRDRGGTMVFKGVGEVILPDLDERPAEGERNAESLIGQESSVSAKDKSSSVSLSDASSEIALERGRGGGSVVLRPPIPAPSTTLAEDLSGPHSLPGQSVETGSFGSVGSSKRPSSNGRGTNPRAHMIEEGVIDRPLISSNGYIDDQTTRAVESASPQLAAREKEPAEGQDAAGELPEDAGGNIEEPLLEGVHRAEAVAFDDSKTEFARGDFDERSPVEEADFNDETVIPMPGQPPAPPPSAKATRASGTHEPLDVSNEAVPLDPVEEAKPEGAGLWDEATVGYPGGRAPIPDDEDSGGPLGFATGNSVEAPAPADAALSKWGDNNVRFDTDATRTGNDDPWDDKTTTNDAYLAESGEAAPAPIVHDVGKRALEEDTADPMPAVPTISGQREALARAMSDGELSGEHTLAASVLFDATSSGEPLTGEEKAGLILGGGDTTGENALDLERFDRGDDPDTELGSEQLDVSSDATIAGRNMILDSGPHQPSFEEGVIQHQKSTQATDTDSRTVAGVSSDFIGAGLPVPKDGTYDEEEGIDLVFGESTSATVDELRKGTPKPKRGGRGLGQIKLSRVAAPTIDRLPSGADPGSFDSSEEMTESGSSLEPELPMPHAKAKDGELDALFEEAIASEQKETSSTRAKRVDKEHSSKVPSKRLPKIDASTSATTTGDELPLDDVSPPQRTESDSQKLIDDAFDAFSINDKPAAPPASSSRRDNSVLLPKVPQPLMPPPNSSSAPAPASPMNIGSTNVPPAALSLNEVLSAPVAARSGLQVLSRQGGAKGPVAPPPAPAPSSAQGLRAGAPRGAGGLRQIREVQRPGSPPNLLNAAPAPIAVTPGQAFIPGTIPQPPGMHEVPPPALVAQARRARASQRFLIALAAVLAAIAVAGVVFVASPFLQRDPQLTVRTTPDGAEIYLNGQLQPAKTPATLGGVQPGASYELRLELAGYEGVAKTVIIPKSTPRVLVTIPLRALKPPSSTP
jgi:serine/threonine protein kinase